MYHHLFDCILLKITKANVAIYITRGLNYHTTTLMRIKLSTIPQKEKKRKNHRIILQSRYEQSIPTNETVYTHRKILAGSN